MGKLLVVVGGQYGSEGKGSIAAFLSAREPKLMAIRVGGPNAGHTVVDQRGFKLALQALPVAAVARGDAQLAIAAGSEVDLGLLAREIAMLEESRPGWTYGLPQRLSIDLQASVLTAEHSQIEYGNGQNHGDDGLTQRIGSTGKGVGACRADRIMRTAKLASMVAAFETDQAGRGFNLTDVARDAAHHLQRGGTVMIEGVQGFGLGLHAGFYPFCTSSDCRAIDFLAMAGLSPWAPYVNEFEVWVVFRTLPIRVAGNSGPLFGEMSWEDLHRESEGRIPLEGELTTVTKKQRRVGRWDPGLARRAMRENGGGVLGSPVRVALTFLDYVFPMDDILSGRGWVLDWVREREEELGARIDLIGLGPRIEDVHELAPIDMPGALV